MGRGRSPRSAPTEPVAPSRPRGANDSEVSSRTWKGFAFRPLPAGSPEARRLFAYRAQWAPEPRPGELVWGAWVKATGTAEKGETDERIVAALVIERNGATGMIHGPVVSEVDEPLEVAAELLAAAVAHAAAEGAAVLFARPQGLDRVWVRLGFIPVPEADLPDAFKGRPGAGLFGWRGGSALWSTRKPDTVEAGRSR